MGVAWWNLQAQLYVAIQNEDLDKAGKVLESGVDCDARFLVGSHKRPAVCICVERGSLALVELLLSWGCSLNQTDAHGWTPLHIAAAHGYTDLVFLLLKNHANPNAVSNSGQTPLHLASQGSAHEVVQLLLKAGSDVNRQDNIQKTALMYACSNNSREIVESLLKFGADPNLQDVNGNTAIQYATDMHLDYDIIKLLLEANADVNIPNDDQMMPLHSVIRNQHRSKHDVLQLLLNCGCDVNAPTTLGQTPLHLACLERDEASARILILHGCDINTCDKLGATPLFHAARDCSTRLVRLMIEAGMRGELTRQPFLNDALLQAEIHSEQSLSCLTEAAFSVPSLESMCRLSFRLFYGRHANVAIDFCNIPSVLKRFLMFDDILS